MDVITKRKTVSSFDQVLRFTGNLDYRYLRKSVESIRKAIQAFQPDIIYSEFNLSAYIAAELEHVRLAATVSFPTQADYACVPKLAGGLNRLLKEYGLPQVNSALDLFDRPEVKICPSIPELEPFNRQDVIYSGTWKMVQKRQCKRNKIVVYMGNGTISAPRTEKVVRKAFSGSRRFDVYIASSYLKEKEEGNIHIAERWDFNELLDEAALFINHGGQNSIVDGLIHGVPQIMVPGKVFERKYNAGAVAVNNAGTLIMSHEFEPKHLQATAKKLILSKEARKNASRLGKNFFPKGESNR